MSSDALLIVIMGLAVVVLPLLFAFAIGRRISARTVAGILLALMVFLLAVAGWIFFAGPDGGYGREFTAGLFLFYVALPVFLSAAVAMMVGQWAKKRAARNGSFGREKP